MTAWDAVRQKRAIRSFADRPLEEAHLARILDAGRRAHSSKNQQRWEFVIVRDRARLAELSSVGPYAGHIAGASAAIALVTPDPRADGAALSITWDLGGAAAQMMLVAWELGVGSCPATVYEHDRVRSILGLPDGLHCEYMLSFGYPADADAMTRPSRAGGRRPPDALVHQERWGGGRSSDAS
jgi:nitroreductase